MSSTVQDLHQLWRRFSRQAMCIFEGSLKNKVGGVKVSYMKLWVGDKGLDVFEESTFSYPEDEAKFTVVVKKFEEYYAPRKKKHVTAALKFSERRQRGSLSFESFVTDQKILVKDCSSQEEDRLVRDTIVFPLYTSQSA